MNTAYGRPHITAGSLDEHSTRAGAIASALLFRHDPSKFPLSASARQYHSRSLTELARECLEAAGVRTAGMSRSELAGRALEVRGGYHTTSDFSGILADVANKTLRAAYDQAPRTFAPFTRRGTARDFKAIHRVQLGEAPQLSRVNKHGEFQRGTITEGKESYRLAT